MGEDGKFIMAINSFTVLSTAIFEPAFRAKPLTYWIKEHIIVCSML